MLKPVKRHDECPQLLLREILDFIHQQKNGLVLFLGGLGDAFEEIGEIGLDVA